MTYPTLLPLPIPHILAYSVETVIAEKFEAMISLAAQNSRMKDFYDVFKLLQNTQLNYDVLTKAIENTFSQRETAFEKNHIVFTNEFATDAKRHEEWKGFLKKMSNFIQVEHLDFQSVMTTIVDRIHPIYDKLGG